MCIYAQHSAHLVVDLEGWYQAGAPYVDVTPERLLDTRPDTAVGYAGQKPVAGRTVTAHIAGAGMSAAGTVCLFT